MAAEQNGILYRGTTCTLRWTMTTNGSVSGWTTRLSLRQTSESADPLALDVAGSIVDAGSVSTPGIFSAVVTKAQSVALLARRYAASFERVDSGNEDVLWIGILDVRYDVRNPK